MTAEAKQETDTFRYERALLRLITEVRRVRQCRQMSAAEPPATQDAWDRLQLAVLEAEQLLAKPVDKSKS